MSGYDCGGSGGEDFWVTFMLVHVSSKNSAYRDIQHTIWKHIEQRKNMVLKLLAQSTCTVEKKVMFI